MKHLLLIMTLAATLAVAPAQQVNLHLPKPELQPPIAITIIGSCLHVAGSGINIYQHLKSDYSAPMTGVSMAMHGAGVTLSTGAWTAYGIQWFRWIKKSKHDRNKGGW